MMKWRNQILAGILFVQIIVSVVVFWPRSTASEAVAPLIPELSSDAVVALTITDGSDNRTALRRVGADWVVPDADDYPAKGDSITSLLEKIVGLDTRRLVTRTEASHRRLQVAADAFQRRIELETADGTKYVLYVGSALRSGVTHVRLEGQSETYLTGSFSAWEADANLFSWIDQIYLRLPEKEILAMVLENANGTFRFARDREVWKMVGLELDEVLDQVKFSELLQRLTSLSMVRSLGKEELPEYGMTAPNAVVTIETMTRTVTLRVGAQDPDDKSYAVISSESPYYVRISEYTGDQFVKKTREDFIQAPATPTPTP